MGRARHALECRHPGVAGGPWHAIVSPGRPVIAPWLGRRCAFLSVVFVEGIEVLG